MPTETIDRPQLVIPEANRAVSVKESEAEFMKRFVAEKDCARTLEIGLAYGRSAIAVLEGSSGTHVVMDPFQNDAWEGLGLSNIERFGFSDRVEFHEDFSWAVLPRLKDAERTFDFAFIDGDHRFEGAFGDFMQVDRVLEVGGFALLHDTWMRSIQLTANYIRKNRDDYVERPTGERNLVLFEKTGQCTRDWHHFREFYTWKSFVRHKLIAGLLHGNGGPLGTLAKRVHRWRVKRRG